MDLSELIPVAATKKVLVGGREMSLRALTAAEYGAVRAQMNFPMRPQMVDGVVDARAQEVFDKRQREAFRRALAVNAVATLGITVDGVAWSRSMDAAQAQKLADRVLETMTMGELERIAELVGSISRVVVSGEEGIGTESVAGPSLAPSRT